MTRQDMERRLRQDAHAIDAACPDTPRQNVRRRLRGAAAMPPAARRAWPWALAGAAALMLLVIGVQIDPPSGRRGDLAAPVRDAAQPAPRAADQALARQEQLLRAELAAIEADFMQLRRLVGGAAWQAPPDGA